MSEQEKWCWLIIKVVICIGFYIALYAFALGAILWLAFFIVLFNLARSKL